MQTSKRYFSWLLSNLIYGQQEKMGKIDEKKKNKQTNKNKK